MDWKEDDIDEKQCFSFFALEAISMENAYDFLSQMNQQKNCYTQHQNLKLIQTSNTNDKTKEDDDNAPL